MAIALGGHGLGISVFQAVLTRLQLGDAAINALQQGFGTEASHHNRHAVTGHQLAVFRFAHHRAHMACRQHALHMAGRIGQQLIQHRCHAHMGHQQLQIVHASGDCFLRQQGCCWCGGFKPHCEEHHLALRFLLGNLQHIKR